MKKGDWLRTVGRFAAMVVVTCGVIVLPAIADDVHGAQKPGATLEERITAGNLKYRDSRTGEIVVATAENVAALRKELAPQFDWSAGAEVTIADDGTVRADINGAMRDVHVARINPDGTRELGCFRNLDAAVAFIVGLDRAEAKRAGVQTPVAVAE